MVTCLNIVIEPTNTMHKNIYIDLQSIKIKDIANIEALTQSVVVTLYNGDYINYQKTLKEVLSELGEKCI